jgi:hypothetical protein
MTFDLVKQCKYFNNSKYINKCGLNVVIIYVSTVEKPVAHEKEF